MQELNQATDTQVSQEISHDVSQGSESLISFFDKTGLVGYPLMLCSVLVLAIIIERSIFFIKGGGYQAAKDYLLAIVDKNKSKKKQYITEALAIESKEATAGLFKNLKVLRIIGTLSPLLGLLGTVVGIIKAFMKIAGTTQTVTPNLIADGIWEAMLTTAFGLVVALIALIAAHIFGSIAMKQNNKIEKEVNLKLLKLDA